jgi:hypothetical protein
MRPDLIVERVGGLHIFSGETERGTEWLAARAATAKHQRLGKSLAVEDEQEARDLADAALADGLDVME